MEINHYGDTLLGLVLQEDVVEGRMLLLTTNVHSRNFGSQSDLPGAKLPDNATEASRAKFCVAFEQDNRSLPLYQPHPSFDWALRYGFDQDANAPFSATVYLTHPGVQVGQTIPSGQGAVGFGDESIITVPSGAYVYSAEIAVPGTYLEVANTNDDGAGSAGKLMVGTTAPVAEVVRFNSDNDRLTFRIFE